MTIANEFIMDPCSSALFAGRFSELTKTVPSETGSVRSKAAYLLALNGSGRIAEAAAYAERETSALASTALGRIAVGNLDQLRARLSDAFQAYEEGLAMAREEGLTHTFTYGRIWRELALARFGDHGSVGRLSILSAEAGAAGHEGLSALATGFAAAAAAIVGVARPAGSVAIDAKRHPGSAALAAAVAVLSGESRDDVGLSRLVAATDGIDGAPELVGRALRHLAAPEADAWISVHVAPIDALIAAEDATLFPTLPEEPRMAPMDCARCDGRCCYDGVYVTGPEEERIRAFMKAHPEDFRHVPEAFLEDGEWGFLFHGRRTIRVPHPFVRDDFPPHFTRTKCIFALPTGECSLQKSATEHFCHPWKVKPELCWEFPLIGLFNDNAMEKPHYFGEPDPGYYDEAHPGYLSFMPCARLASEGTGWKRMYRTEFLHYFKVKGIRRG